MSFLAINIPPTLATRIQEFDVPGNKDYQSHCTMFYFGKEIKISQIFKIIESTLEITQQTQPFLLTSNFINCFPINKDGKIPIKLEVDSLGLLQLRKKIAKIFDQNKVFYDQKFPKYQPHITLSYNDQEIKPIKLQIPVTLQVTELTLWTGIHGPSRLVCTFPLEFNVKKSNFSIEINKTACYSEAFQRLIF